MDAGDFQQVRQLIMERLRLKLFRDVENRLNIELVWHENDEDVSIDSVNTGIKPRTKC